MSKIRVVLVEFDGDDSSAVLDILREAFGTKLSSAQAAVVLEPPEKTEPSPKPVAVPPAPTPPPPKPAHVLVVSAPAVEKPSALAQQGPIEAKIVAALKQNPRAKIHDLAKAVYGDSLHASCKKVSSLLNVLKNKRVVQNVSFGVWEVAQ